MSAAGDDVLGLVSLARARVLPGPEENVGAPLGPRLDSVVDLVRAGEEIVAFEVLLDNLLDYDIPLSLSERDTARSVGLALSIAPERLAHIEELGFPPGPRTQ